jgi:hypothetical protein
MRRREVHWPTINAGRLKIGCRFIKDRPPRGGLSRIESQPSLRRLVLLDRRRSFSDHSDDYVRLREHGNVAAFHFYHGRSHTLRHPPLEIGMNGVVLQAQNVPTWLRLPRGALEFLLLEQVGDRRKMGGPDELLLLLGKVSAEKRDSR